MGKKQSGDARVGSGDFGALTPGSQAGRGLAAVGLLRQSDGRSVASRATTHVNRGEVGIHPSPDKTRKNPGIPWAQFIRANLDSMVATDFLTKDIYTPFGRYTAYVLIFIHLGREYYREAA